MLDLEIGALYLQQQPGRVGLVRYLGVEQGSLAFLCLTTGSTLYYPYASWSGIQRRVSVHEVVEMRRKARC